MISLLIGVTYFGQHIDLDGVMNINGALFVFLNCMTFQNVFAVINVRFRDISQVAFTIFISSQGKCLIKIETNPYPQVFCAELPIFLREHRNGMYRTDVYFICKTLAEAPIFLAIPLMFTIVVYPMIGLYPDVRHFFITAAVLTLVANVSTSFGKKIYPEKKSIYNQI